MFRTLIPAVGALSILASVAIASVVGRVDLEPIQHQQAELVVVAPDGTETAYTPAQIEEFPTYQMTTRSPWREVPAVFEGALLQDILAANGLAEVDAIIVTAENDYQTVIEREIWESVDIMVATRVDGEAHSRRVRGPIQFMIEEQAFAASPLTSESNLVWMAARIEAAN